MNPLTITEQNNPITLCWSSILETRKPIEGNLKPAAICEANIERVRGNFHLDCTRIMLTQFRSRERVCQVY